MGRGSTIVMVMVLVLPGLFALTGCKSARAPIELSCVGNEHCPANGEYYCDLTEHRCVLCKGPCPYEKIPDQDGGSLANTTEMDTAAAGLDDTSGQTAVASDAIAGCDAAADAVSLTTGTCQGKCGHKGTPIGSDAPTCWCDPACDDNGDCCPDYTALCSCLNPDPLTHCKGRCGKRDPNAKCHCDFQCDKLGDCCADFASSCQSCVGRCSDPFDLAAPCNCDKQCAEFDDCCFDYDQTCGKN